MAAGRPCLARGNKNWDIRADQSRYKVMLDFKMQMSEETKNALRKSWRYHREEFALPPIAYLIILIFDGNFKSPIYLPFLNFVVFVFPIITIIRIYITFRKFRYDSLS